MNTYKFFEAFTELDDDLIENALPQAQESEVVRPAERIRLWKPIVSAAAVAVLACGVTVAGIKLYNSIGRAPASSVSESGQQASSEAFSSNYYPGKAVKYSYILIDEQVYSTAGKLIDQSDMTVMGKVTDISFELHDEHTGELLTEYSKDACLCTIYDVDVIKTYKGNENEKIRIIMYNGLEEYQVGKQLELIGEHYIPVLENPVDITLGGEYLFALSKSTAQSSTGDTMTSLLNHSQSAFRIEQSTVREQLLQASLAEVGVLLTLHKNNQMTVIHNDQSMLLTNQQFTALTDAMIQAVTTECLPDVQLNMALSDQRIKEYGKNGYAITVQYNDFSAPTYAYGDSTDKMARGISNVTVLIGADGEPSYITYSYILFPLSGGSERQDGGVYALSDSSREQLLQILGDHDSLDHDIDHDDSNHESEHDDTDHNSEHDNSDETSSPPDPNVYFNTKPADYALAKEQVSFTDVKEVFGTGFVGYELEYVMPSETLVSLNYVFTDGKISVKDNSAGIGTIVISPEWYEENKRGGMSFWRFLQDDQTTVIYISEANIAYTAEFGSDTDVSQAINRIISILNDDNSSHESDHDSIDHNSEHDNNTHEVEHHDEPAVISTAHHSSHH